MIEIEFQILALFVAAICIAIIYRLSDKQDISDTFRQLRAPWYWTWYNIAEWAWISVRMGIIVPVMIFGLFIWQLYFLGFAAACVITWVSIKKKMPEFVFYYTFWIWLSSTILLSHLLK